MPPSRYDLFVGCIEVIPDEFPPIGCNDVVTERRSDHTLVRVIAAQNVAAPTQRPQVWHIVRPTAREWDDVINLCHSERDGRCIAAIRPLTMPAVARPHLLSKLLPDRPWWSALPLEGVVAIMATTPSPMPCLAIPGLAMPCLA
jgi:hypothetical protein